MIQSVRWSACELIVFGLVVLWSGAAGAAGGCDGTLNATSLRPLPTSPIVKVDVFDRSPVKLRLAAQFEAGPGDAGVSVGGRPNVLIRVIRRRSTNSTLEPVVGSRRASPISREWKADADRAPLLSSREGVGQRARLLIRAHWRSGSMLASKLAPGSPGSRESSARSWATTRNGLPSKSGASLARRSGSEWSGANSNRGRMRTTGTGRGPLISGGLPNRTN